MRFLSILEAVGLIRAGTAKANQIVIDGSAASSAPTIAVTGSDANIGMNLQTKGTGSVTVNGTPLGASDMLSVLTAAEISVTAAATLTAGRMHAVSGTAADYTVTLPAVSGNAGKFVGLRIAPGCTRWITLKGTGSETIDGANTRIMWRNEAATLYCDGVTWTKVAGKTIPISVAMRRTTAFSVASGAWLAIPMPTVVSDNTSTMAVPAGDTANGRVTAPRTGTYLCGTFLSLDGLSPSDSVGMGLAVNAVSPQDNPNCWSWATTRTSGYTSSASPMPVTAGQYVNAIMYQGTGGSKNTGSVGTAYPSLSVTEIPAW